MKSSSASASKPRGYFPSRDGCCFSPGFWGSRRRRRSDSFALPRNDIANRQDYTKKNIISSSSDFFYDCQEYEEGDDEHDDEPRYHQTEDVPRHAKFQEDLKYIISCLTDEELEVAARTSYHYLKSSQHHDREKYALAMARRYLKSKKQVSKALQCLKDTLHFRTMIRIDDLRQAFDIGSASHSSNGNTKSDNTSTTNTDADKKLAHMLSSKKNYVMGYDKDGRGTFIFVPRCSLEHDTEWTLKESLYTMERALACTEEYNHNHNHNYNHNNNNNNNDDDDSSVVNTINAVIDFSGFDLLRQTPPFSIGKEFLLVLRKHYVGCFHKIFILDAPFGFAALWKLFSPFVGTSTRSKIFFLSHQEKDRVLRTYYLPHEAATDWMLVDGTKNRALDVHEYLYITPFDHAFDD